MLEGSSHLIMNFNLLISVLQELFLNLVPSQCLGGLWGHRDRPGHSHLCPSVRATVTQFNKVAGAVVSSVLGAIPTGEGPGEVTIRPLRPPQRARLLEKWIRVAEVREDYPMGDYDVERGPTALAFFLGFHRSADCSETSLQFTPLCQPCSPAPSTGFGQLGGKQPGGRT